MGESVLYDVLSVIRQKQKEADMDIKPSKRIFGTDMEHPDTTEEYLKDMARRVRIKEKLRAAREKRRAKLEELDKGIDKQLDDENSASGTVNIPLTGKLSMGDVVKEYIARRGKSVKLQEDTNNTSNSPSDSANSKQDFAVKTDSVNPDQTDVPSDVKVQRPSTCDSPVGSKEDSSKLVVTVDIEYNCNNIQEEGDDSADQENCSKEEDFSVTDVKNCQENTENEPNSTTDDSNNLKIDHEIKNCEPESDNVCIIEESIQRDIENNDAKLNRENVPPDVQVKPKSSKARKKWKKAKLLPITLAAAKLKQKMEEENQRQMEFLETLRVLRGIPRDEFYKDVEESSSEEDDESSDETEEEEDETLRTVNTLQDKEVCEGDSEQPSPSMTNKEEDLNDENEEKTASAAGIHTDNDENSNEQTDNNADSVLQDSEINSGVNEVKICRKKTRTKKTTPGCRVDTRWPVGHPLHTRPEILYLSSQNSYPRNGQNQRPRIATYSKRNIVEYEQWREQLLQIAYLKEFDHIKGKSLREFSLPLPEIYTPKREFQEKDLCVYGIKSLAVLSGQKSEQSSFSDTPLSDRKVQRKRFRRRSQTVSYLLRDSKKGSTKTTTTFDTKKTHINSRETVETESFTQEPLNELQKTAVEDVRSYDNINDKDSYCDRKSDGDDVLRTTYNLRSEQSQSSDSAINEPSNHSDLEDDSVERLSEPPTIPVVHSRQMEKISVNDYRSLRKPNCKSREDRVMENLYQLRANRYKTDPDHPESTQKHRNRKTIDRSKMRKRTELLPLFSSSQGKSTKKSPRVWNNDKA